VAAAAQEARRKIRGGTEVSSVSSPIWSNSSHRRRNSCIPPRACSGRI